MKSESSQLYSNILFCSTMNASDEKYVNAEADKFPIEESSSKGSTSVEEYTDMEADDGLLKKMNLVNNAVEEIGLTWYHLKLFFLAGFGYSADSQVMIVQSSVATQVSYQFGVDYPYTTECLYIGLFLGALIIGFGADIMGRKRIFNLTLLLTCIFGFFIGGMSSLATYNIFLVLAGITCGGNLALDVTVFLEVLPFKWKWVTTTFASWWGVGQTIATLFAWAFIANYSCESKDFCPSSINRGWRYCWYANSALLLVCALARLFVFKMEESPKFLVSVGRDEEAVAALQNIAHKYNRKCSLTLDQLAEYNADVPAYFNEKEVTVMDILKISLLHLKKLFATRKAIRSTITLFVSWLCMGVCYAVYSNFVSEFLKTRMGSNQSTFLQYRDSTLTYFVSIFGPTIAAILTLIPRVGYRGALAIGGVVAMALLFGYTSADNENASVGFSTTSYLGMNIYYGCLFAYTPEVFPAGARTTGAGIGLLLNRIGGIIAPIVVYYGDTTSSIPLWVCGAIIGFIGLCALTLPFEPTKHKSL